MTQFSLSASVFVILLALISFTSNAVIAKNKPMFFIFGDSTVDPGNNNYINTTADNRANFPPYGRIGGFAAPTGRFSDGRVNVDFLAEYAGLPLIPAYLDPSADYSHGVNFGSGGAGVLPSTNNDQGVIDIKTQLRYFKKVKKQLEKKLGDFKAAEEISNAVYFVSMGSNDYLGGYLGSPKMQELYNPEKYVGIVIGNLTKAIQELYKKGARKFGFLSLLPLGCLPALRVINPKPPQGGCFEQANGLAMAHNNALKVVLNNLDHLYPDFKYSNFNIYNQLLDRMDNPSTYGFKEGVKACCGLGPFNGIYSCGGLRKVTSFELCDNGDEYVWWDSYHTTERVHEQFAKAMWDGPRASVGPYNMQELFFHNHKQTIADEVDNVPKVEEAKI